MLDKLYSLVCVLFTAAITLPFDLLYQILNWALVSAQQIAGCFTADFNKETESVPENMTQTHVTGFMREKEVDDDVA